MKLDGGMSKEDLVGWCQGGSGATGKFTAPTLCSEKKHQLTFSIINPAFLGRFFCTNGNRNEYSTIYLFNGLMTS